MSEAVTTTAVSNNVSSGWQKRSWYEFVISYVEGNHNNSAEMSKPHLRHTFVNSSEFVIFVYLLISVCGVIVNTIEIYFIIKYRLFRDATYVYLINLSLADLVKCLFVLPFSVTMLLLQNWLFGGFMCYFIPMLQVSYINGFHFSVLFKIAQLHRDELSATILYSDKD